MPEALATTKRKFHRLLDSRFGPPTTQLAPNPVGAAVAPNDTQHTTSEPAAKRIRSGTTTSTTSVTQQRVSQARSSVTAVARSTSLTSLRHPSINRTTTVSKTGISALPKAMREPPNFAPWSHDIFLSRLRTFGRVSQWHPKPEGVNEVQWAKRGWSCVDTNTVACKGGCGKRVLVDVEPVPRRRRRDAGTEDEGRDEEEEGDEGGEDDEEMEKALVERYKGLIVDGHAEGCLWRQAGCKDDIYRLPIVKTVVWQPELRERFMALLKISASFQHVHLKPDDLKPSMEKLLTDLPPTLLAQTDAITTGTNTDSDTEITSSQARQHALLIGLTGWRGVTDSGTDLLTCAACFQRIGLWMYQPDYKRKTHSIAHDEAGEIGDDNPADQEDQEDRSLNLVDLHREHCPWRNGESQCAQGGDYAGWPAWRIQFSILERCADEYRRRSRGQLVTSSREGAVSEGDAAAADDGVVGEEGTSVADGLELMPELTREETEKLDKERTSKLRRLKSVFGFNKARTIKRRESTQSMFQ